MSTEDRHGKWRSRNVFIPIIVGIALLGANTIFMLSSRIDDVAEAYNPTTAQISREMAYLCPGVTGVEATRSCTREAVQAFRADRLALFDRVATASDVTTGSVQALAAIGTLCISLMALLVLRDTLTEARDTAASATQAAKAAVDANVGFELSAERQLRAYVSAIEAKVEIAVGHAPTVAVLFKNCGQTPARNVTIISGVGFRDPNLPEDLFIPHSTENASVRSLGPGAMSTTIVYAPATARLTQAHVDLLKNPHTSHAVRVLGRATYTDVFDRTRTTSWRLYSRWDGNSFVLDAAEDGNDET